MLYNLSRLICNNDIRLCLTRLVTHYMRGSRSAIGTGALALLVVAILVLMATSVVYVLGMQTSSVTASTVPGDLASSLAGGLQLTFSSPVSSTGLRLII